MSVLLSGQNLQFIIWFFVLVEFILALYILLLNAWHTANRHVSALLALFAISNWALGIIVGATSGANAVWAFYVLAATLPAIELGRLLVAVVLLKPHWRRGRWRGVWWIVYALLLLPAVLTVVDAALDTQLWYTGVIPDVYAGGYVSLSEYAAGSLSLYIGGLSFVIIPLLNIIFLGYVVVASRKRASLLRVVALLLLGAEIVGLSDYFWMPEQPYAPLYLLGVNVIFAVVYAYAGFRQMAVEGRLQRGRLQTRLTVLMLGVTVPLSVLIATLVSERAGDLISQNSIERLGAANRALASNVSLWLDLNAKALQELATLSDITSMDAELQKPLLENMERTYPHIYLVSTTDLKGLNVARSDELLPENYRTEFWHIGGRNGVPVTFDVLKDETTGRPAMVISVPIRKNGGSLTGVAMFASTLTDMTQEVKASKIGETGFAYIVDAQNRVVAHPDPEFILEVQDLDRHPPVFALRGGKRGIVTFEDEAGQLWRAYVDELDNGWGIIVQQQESEFLSALAQFRQITWIAMFIGAVLLASLTWFVIRQAFRPIEHLTETATAIAAGDLERRARVEGEDEIGVMAQAFNSMTGRLRELIGGLEQRIAERTHDLEQRSVYLEASAEVSRAVTSVLDLEQLINQMVELIAKRFGLDHVGLFLVDETGRWASYRAGTGEAAREMVEEGIRLEVGGNSMVGWSVANAESRVALDVTEEAVRYVDPRWPNVGSEAVLPLRARGRVIGALDVQSVQVGKFDSVFTSLLQTMADQVAVAIDNAQLFTESQEALEAERRAYGELSRLAWVEMARRRTDWGYLYSHGDVSAVKGGWQPEMIRAMETEQVSRERDDANDSSEGVLAIPIKLREQVIGALQFRKGEEGMTWTTEEIALLETLTEQLSVALESARLYQDTQSRAAREQLAREITDKMRRAADVDALLRVVVEETSRALGVSQAYVSLTSETEAGRGD